MKITKIRMRRATSTRDSAVVANFDLVLDDHLHIRGFRLVREEGRFAFRCPDAPIVVTCNACRGQARRTDVFCPHCGKEQPKRSPRLTSNGCIKRFSSVTFSESSVINQEWLTCAALVYERFALTNAPEQTYAVAVQGNSMAFDDVALTLCAH